MSIMNTYTGKKFDPLQMKPEDVDLVDIAHALSLLVADTLTASIPLLFIPLTAPTKQRPAAGNESSFLHVSCMMPARLILQILSAR